MTADLAQIWPEALLNAKVVVWFCLNREHKLVDWQDGVASCRECGLTSEMTRRHAAAVRDSLLAAGWAPVAETRQALTAFCEQHNASPIDLRGIDALAMMLDWGEDEYVVAHACQHTLILERTAREHSDSAVSAVRSAGGRGREGTR